MKNYIGRKCKGFRFESGVDGVTWDLSMEPQIGKIGVIKIQCKDYVGVKFGNGSWDNPISIIWHYPISLIEEHLIPETPEIPQLGEGVWYPVYYNGIETNLEVTKCGRVKRVFKEWIGKNSFLFGEVDFSKLKSAHGYKRIKVKIKGFSPRQCTVHQLIASTFLNYKFGQKEYVIDHIDSNTLNNNFDNLRLISHRENTSKERSLKSGLPTGVHYNKKAKRYQSRIQIDGIRVFLGEFKNIQDASNAYQNKLSELLKHARPIPEVKKYTKEELVKIVGHDFEMV